MTAARAVTFDLDGTLVTYDRPWPEFVGAALGVEADADADGAVVETFGTTLQAGLRALRTDAIEHAAAEAVREHDLDRDPATVAQDVRNAEVAATVAVPGARRLVEGLAARGPVGVVTNGDDALQRRKLADLGLVEHLDAVVVSGGVGVRKPDAEIFEAAADRLAAETYLHAGDDRTEDVGGALAAGWEAVHVAADTAPEDPVATVHDVSRLADLL